MCCGSVYDPSLLTFWWGSNPAFDRVFLYRRSDFDGENQKADSKA